MMKNIENGTTYLSEEVIDTFLNFSKEKEEKEKRKKNEEDWKKMNKAIERVINQIMRLNNK